MLHVSLLECEVALGLRPRSQCRRCPSTPRPNAIPAQADRRGLQPGQHVLLPPLDPAPQITKEIEDIDEHVDERRHTITFGLPRWNDETVKAGRTIDLSAVQPGETVTMQVGQGLAVTVEKP